MSESTPNAKGPAPVQYTPEATEPTLIPADQVKPEDIGTLSIEYRDGWAVVVASGGTYIPAGLTVVDRIGNAVAVYTATVDVGAVQAASVLVGKQAPDFDIPAVLGNGEIVDSFKLTEALSLRYVDKQPQLVVSGGTGIPAGLKVVNGSRNAVAVYTATSVAAAQARAGGHKVGLCLELEP
ncbi:hypothetical protein OHU11_08400 [Streptomyces sp. NBC_00257]|uniref:hypothetical protein n=1 Tax=unclassified Streptomyces TaxID=2593676 RepID=UPI0022555951|nr:MULTISPECIES: hypothetical protein [unclassified Streptomyces]MCX5427695.1 hypothetical protein [Streptomyces sp. NBC_00062]